MDKSTEINILKDGDIITASDLVKIIENHGGGMVEVDGSMASKYNCHSELELIGNEKFMTSLNYGHEVQFHLIGEDIRAIVTTGLKGVFDTGSNDMFSEWHADTGLNRGKV